MKTAAIVPATIEFSEGSAPRAPAFADRYHAEAGAWAQARHVFLSGNGLPARWAARRRFVIVETGFGFGNNFLATWAAWQQDPQRCGHLDFVSIEKHPPTREDLARAHAHTPRPDLAAALVGAWPPATPNVHLLDFDGGQVRLLLALGDVGTVLPQLQAEADAFFLDGFAPRHNPAMWDRRVVKALARLAAPGATAATWTAARSVRDALAASGFEVARTPGFDRKRDMTQARFAPTFTPRRSPGRTPAVPAEATAPRRALILGAGLAGASAATSLARLGWQCTVLDRCADPAGAASGNPAGLFHGTVHAADGPHARFTRAAALLAADRYRRLIEQGLVAGDATGLVRLRAAATLPSLPTQYVESIDGRALAYLTGLALDDPAWRYPGGGWVAPAEVVAAWLRHPAIEFLGRRAVARVERRGAHWCVLDRAGRVLDQAPVLVLAGGAEAPPPGTGADAWPMAPVRGQVTWFDHGWGMRLPVTGHGYALSLPDGRLLCGATTAADDPDAGVRHADHAFNLQRLEALTGLKPADDAPLDGRTGWRATTPDRLPIVGAVAQSLAALGAGRRVDHARLVPRIPGLFVLGGLASRGLTWAPLAGELLAAWIDGAPLPLEADLVDAVDPARWIVRAARRSGA